ncbi:hypothetical protein PQO03_10065 [Lentisphaera profundi]|uniref:2-dehydro-3-deoxy-6-phosphogalactonate aldolase n=1 Tax=Lentisphaera profundi TaxID=1658616 RepID=A0ABY7VVH5_9BACT|nr:hypothetical protein [Lentisphaera profundi]WDE96058.1 hypothetical protein PQO03_10065 [Lentisphaera profundi]
MPKGTEIYAVGGVDLSNVKDWTEVGADGFGLGGSLYKPGKDLSQLAQDAQSFCQLFK